MNEAVVKKQKRVKRVLTKEEKLTRTKGTLLLVALVLTFVILVVKLVYHKFPFGAILALDIAYAAIFVFFLVEFLRRFIKLKTKDNYIRYFKFNKAEPLYFVLGIILIPFMFAFTDNIWINVFMWITIFKAPSVFRYFKDENVFEVLVRIFLTLLIVFFVFPFLNVIAVAFSSPGYTINIFPQGFTFFSIKYVLSDFGLYRAMGVSIIVTIVGTLISVVSMAMAAYPLAKKDMPFRRTILIFFLIVMLFSGGMAPNIILMDSLGLIDTIWALIFPSVVMVFHLLLLKGFFENIPPELEESARLDGANNYRVLFSIIVPVAIPMIATVSLFTAINYWNNLNNSILYLIANKSLYPLPMFIKNFLSRNPMDIAMQNPELLAYWENLKMAYIFVSIIPIACLYPIILKYFTKGVAVGAVKG